jgi:hypothetical protein
VSGHLRKVPIRRTQFMTASDCERRSQTIHAGEIHTFRQTHIAQPGRFDVIADGRVQNGE